MEVDKEFANIFHESQMVSGMLVCFLYYVRAIGALILLVKESNSKE